MKLLILAVMAISLTPRQQALSAIAACEAKGDQVTLTACLNEGFDHGLTVSEAKEALSQLYAYTGFPRSLNALGSLQAVLADREAQGLKTAPGREADPLPADYDALKQGTEVQTRLSGRPFHYAFAPQTDYYLKAHLFGDIFARNNLSHAERQAYEAHIRTAHFRKYKDGTADMVRSLKLIDTQPLLMADFLKITQ